MKQGSYHRVDTSENLIDVDMNAINIDPVNRKEDALILGFGFVTEFIELRPISGGNRLSIIVTHEALYNEILLRKDATRLSNAVFCKLVPSSLFSSRLNRLHPARSG